MKEKIDRIMDLYLNKVEKELGNEDLKAEMVNDNIRTIHHLVQIKQQLAAIPSKL